MANAMLFYRTLVTRKIDAGFTTVALLLANAPTQCLLFTPPADLASRINDDYTNNIVRKIPPEPFGRRINQTDEGCSGWLVNLEGNFLKATGDSNSKVHNFAKLAQGDSYHKFGRFGISWPNGPTYLSEIDPDTTKGFMIVNRRGTHIGVTKEMVDFAFSLSYGGDIA